ncbi:ATP-dependent helicase [Halomonas campisalis]|uniref:DNA 3'-5' helicase n=1 Tax=Billgrantia campisalis TaxID=74661 RepID=A0ABS9P7U7_9GAMM|nr:ATP-dependent helicase [Halomonas campisalis]MCG6657859.1 ATP-dependent helicase [Halomonas campisalis]MDR5863617.1 ATP-dependent helicase [Halomonas campisalis]
MRLTAEQRAVVEHGDGHARVAAVAGSGKTTTLVARVLQLLERGVPAARILVLMFNRSAREDFQARLAALAPPGQRLPDVRTFHSLGHRLTGSLTRWGALSPRRLLSADWQVERLLRQASLEVLGDDPERRENALEADTLDALAHFCGLVKAEMASPAALYQRLDFAEETRHFVDAFQRLEELLAEHGLMTYSDLLYRPLRALEADPALTGRVQGFLDQVIIDEYQDINQAQLRLLATLAGRDAAVMAVGDANQCIYEWRGAHPDTMREHFSATFGPATDYPLSTTFRHGHALALAANHAIAANRRRPDQLCLAAPGTPFTSLAVDRGPGALLAELAAWQRAGRHLDEVCLLVRSWALSVVFQLQLLQAGIPFRLSREDRFVFRLPLVQALAGYLRLALSPGLLRDPALLQRLLEQPTPFVARERLAALARRLADTQTFPERHDPLLAGLKPIQRRNLSRRWALLCELPRLAGWSPVRLLTHVVDSLDAEKVLKRAAARREKGEEDVRLLDVLVEQAAELSDIEAFIELLERPVENHADGVLITTVHGAKGLEWPLVALGGVNEEDFPHYGRDNPLTADRLEEERRLFYVAITRARERLLILHDGGEHRPSRFIGETAWQDCLRVAARLDGEGDPQAPLAVGAPARVAGYLQALGRELPLRPLVAEAAPGAVGEAPLEEYRPGQRLRHAVFGEGEVAVVEGDPADPVIEVCFRQSGRRRLLAKRAPIERLSDAPSPVKP